MAKINPQKKIQKRRTEVEMRQALLKLYDSGGNMACLTADVDSPDVILQDCIEELLEARQMIEDIKAFVQSWTMKLVRR